MAMCLSYWKITARLPQACTTVRVPYVVIWYDQTLITHVQLNRLTMSMDIKTMSCWMFCLNIHTERERGRK